MEKTCDVIVVGAGIAGSTCAWLLSKKGFKVIVLERQSPMKEKVCSGGITVSACNILDRIGLLDELLERPHKKCHGILIATEKYKTTWMSPQTALRKYSGLFIRREYLDALVLSKAKENSVVKEGFMVEKLLFEDSKVIGVKASTIDGKEEEFFAKCVIGADGANSMVARETGNLLLNPKHQFTVIRAYFNGIKGLGDFGEFYFFASIYPGYFTILPLAAGETNVALGTAQEKIKREGIDIKKEFKRIIEENPEFKERFKEAKMISKIEGAPIPSGALKNKCYGNCFMLIGDAARLVDPLSGGGIFGALRSAEIAAETVEKAFKSNDFSEKAFEEYSKKIDKEIRKDFYTGYLVQRLFAIKPLRDFFFRKISEKQELAAIFNGLFEGSIDKKMVFSPRLLIKMLF